MKSPPFNAQLRQQSSCPVPAHYPQKRQDQPYCHAKPTNRAKRQYSQIEDDSPVLDKAGKKFIQELCGVFLYLARAVDGGLLPVLSSLASQQVNPTEKRQWSYETKFLDYMAMQEDATPDLPRKHLGLSIPQQCIIFIQIEILQLCGRTHVHGRKG